MAFLLPTFTVVSKPSREKESVLTMPDTFQHPVLRLWLAKQNPYRVVQVLGVLGDRRIFNGCDVSAGRVLLESEG